MFDKIPERKARYIRRALALGWVLIIVFLFWDPVTVEWTRPDNDASPFRLNPKAAVDNPLERYQCPLYVQNPASGTLSIDWGDHAPGTCDSRCIQVQGQCLIEKPYSMAARIFWAMVIPIVPLFLMVFGHEAWRRICPLSFFSQIPRALGIQHREKSVNMKTGLVEKKVVLITPDSWLGKYYWFVQFGLLFTGLTARLLFINSDRFALAIFFIIVIYVAMVIGYFYGGKTWCNYICPLSPVQKIYSEPRGLLESQAHLNKQTVTQSMCRTISKEGREQSNCVGCKSPCPDIDLERAYWENIQAPGRRFAYYGYLGLVFGFYYYYFLYSGNWEYYFSGAWTHEEGQLQQLLNPGMYWFGHSLPIPKIIAAPLTLAILILSTYGVGRLFENLYERTCRHIGKPLSREQIRHHMFTFFSYLTINTFYLFGGRPNLNLLPPLALGMVDISIVALTSFWAWRTFGLTSKKYKRESLGDSLRRQLKKLKLDFTQMLEGRTLEELSPDETYVLAKTLPGFSHERQNQVYKEMLREVLQSGATNSVDSLTLMQELRQQMNVTKQEHEQILIELGVEDSDLLDPHKKQTQEDQLRINNYREAMELLLMQWVEERTPIKQVLQNPEISQQFQDLQALYNVTQTEQSQILSEIIGEQSGLIQDARMKVEQLHEIALQHHALLELGHDLETKTAIQILDLTLAGKRKIICERLMNLLHLLEDTPEAKALAYTLSVLSPEEIVEILQKETHLEGEEIRWRDHFSPQILEILEHKNIDFVLTESTAIPMIRTDQLLEDVTSSPELLLSFLRGSGAITQAAALYLQAELDPQQARKYAVALLNQQSLDGLSTRTSYSLPDWLVQDLAHFLLGTLPFSEPSEQQTTYRIITTSVFHRLLILYEGRFFNHLELEVLTDLAKEAQLREYPRNSIIFRMNDPSNELMLINSGRADVLVQAGDKVKKVLTLSSGQTIGELGVLMHTTRSATVITREETNRIIVLDSVQFEKFLTENSRTAISFLQIIGDRLLQTTSTIRTKELT